MGVDVGCQFVGMKWGKREPSKVELTD